MLACRRLKNSEINNIGKDEYRLCETKFFQCEIMYESRRNYDSMNIFVQNDIGSIFIISSDASDLKQKNPCIFQICEKFRQRQIIDKIYKIIFLFHYNPFNFFIILAYGIRNITEILYAGTSLFENDLTYTAFLHQRSYSVFKRRLHTTGITLII